MTRLALVAALAVALAGTAEAQQGRGGQRGTPAPAPAPQQPAQPQAEPPPPPYEKELLRLAEVMGSLAFLRSLCAAQDAPEWPRRMQALMEAEGTTPGRKERLAGAYNRGYRGFAVTYRICTDSAAEATARYLKEGETLSRGIAGRFGG
ncbi:MAG TPA: TIGR02301 family protein [Beijerinckiaceae bacterium]